ncbi:MAG: SH3 domain-containing protein [Oscillospiraceae bacterium]|nr:SH3 domain-containing protein [Oscillospiraceae bacterium]
MLCSKCGEALSPVEQFCSSCGAKTKEAFSVAIPDSPTPKPPRKMRRTLLLSGGITLALLLVLSTLSLPIFKHNYGIELNIPVVKKIYDMNLKLPFMNPITDVDGDSDADSDNDADIPADFEGLVWAVEPTFDYTTHKDYKNLIEIYGDDYEPTLFYCPLCNTYSFGHEIILDIKTGEVSDEARLGGHGGGYVELLYDAEKKLFGEYMVGEGVSSQEWFSEKEAIDKFSNTMQVYHLIDSDKITRTETEYDGTLYDLSKAYSGKFAAAVGTKFVTDFIYEGDFSEARLHDNLALLKLDGKWGIVDINGDIAVPFIFEELLLIYEYEKNYDVLGRSYDSYKVTTAFAKYDGKYGILNIAETASNFGVEVEVITRENTPIESGEPYRVNTPKNALNLRAEPKADAAILDRIPHKTSLVITEIYDGWAKTTYNDKTGWVSLEYLERID